MKIKYQALHNPSLPDVLEYNRTVTLLEHTDGGFYCSKDGNRMLTQL
jgi:hypothetical protein